MNIIFPPVRLLLLLLVSFSAISAPDFTQNIRDKMKELDIPVDSIKGSPVKGLYEVISNLDVYYVSVDGNYLIYGSVYDINDDMTNMTEERKSLLAKEKIIANLDKLKSFEKDMIIYPANNEKHVVTVFTDPSCPYCKKMHDDIGNYNNLGITIRYLAFPRGGVESSTYREMVRVWCADDKEAAMSKVFARKTFDSSDCENSVKEQYQLGVLLGVTGTPALISEDGRLIPGYLPPKDLLLALERTTD